MRRKPFAIQMEIVAALKRHPNQPVKTLAKLVGCHKRQIQIWLPRLCVVESRGNDPENGRCNVKVYSVRLPAAKRKALA